MKKKKKYKKILHNNVNVVPAFLDGKWVQIRRDEIPPKQPAYKWSDWREFEKYNKWEYYHNYLRWYEINGRALDIRHSYNWFPETLAERKEAVRVLSAYELNPKFLWKRDFHWIKAGAGYNLWKRGVKDPEERAALINHLLAELHAMLDEWDRSKFAWRDWVFQKIVTISKKYADLFRERRQKETTMTDAGFEQFDDYHEMLSDDSVSGFTGPEAELARREFYLEFTEDEMKFVKHIEKHPSELYNEKWWRFVIEELINNPTISFFMVLRKYRDAVARHFNQYTLQYRRIDRITLTKCINAVRNRSCEIHKHDIIWKELLRRKKDV